MDITRKAIKSEELVGGSLKTLLWMLLLCLVASVVLSYYLVSEDIVSSLVTTLVYYPIISILPISLYLRLKPVEKPMTFLRLNSKMEAKTIGRVIMLGFFLAIGVLSSMLILLELLGATVLSNMNFFSSIVSTEGLSYADITNLVVQILLIYVLGAGIFEEIFFRGFLLNGLRPLGRKKAVLMSAIAFALYHMNPVRGLIAFAISMVWGNIAYMLKNTKYAILLHTIYNFTISVFLVIAVLMQYGYINISVSNYVIFGIEAVAMIVSLFIVKKLYGKIKKKAALDAISTEENTKETDGEYEAEHTGEPPLVLWGGNLQYVPFTEYSQGITMDDYLNPKQIALSAKARTSFMFYIFATTVMTLLVLLGS